MRKIFTKYSRYFYPQSLPENAPTFMIVGAQKAGTTALYSFLSQHPGVSATEPKELHFINCENRYALGLDYYHSLFPVTVEKELTFDSSASYLSNLHAAERIFKYNRHVKIIAILKDPVKRAFSAWNMYQERYKINKNWFFENWISMCTPLGTQIIQRSENTLFDFKRYVLEEIGQMGNSGTAILEASVIPQGYYVDQLRRYFTIFPKTQILVIESSELRNDTISTLQNVERFLGLPLFDWSEANLNPVFEGNYEQEVMDNDIFNILTTHYEIYNQKLFQLLGRNFDWS